MTAEDPYVSFRRVPASLDRDAVRSFARDLKKSVAARIEFHCLVTSDAELRRLNGRYRGRPYATDVLSFSESGDIAISFPRARSQAAAFGHAPETEIRILMLHGVLHLLGMDHEQDSGQMRRTELRWRTRLGLPPGLIERADR